MHRRIQRTYRRDGQTRSINGRRISLLLIRALGGSTLGLGYAIVGTELLLGPVIPSNTACSGGVMAPIVNSLARAQGGGENGRSNAGAFLVLCGAHANLIAAAMFFTGMAADPQIQRLPYWKALGWR